MMTKYLILFFCFIAVSAQASLMEMTVYGSSTIKSDSEDMWDKKNEAIWDAKKRATYLLAEKVFKPETLEEYNKRIRKEVVPFSSRFLISYEVLSHGVEEDAGLKNYYARVQFRYSFENFKNLLYSKALKPDNLTRFKVAAFVEVLDLAEIKSYSWWNEENPTLHPVLKPLQEKLSLALQDEGYELLPIQVFGGKMGLREMATAMGAQYYVNGTLKIDNENGKYVVKEGLFNFHEALSQKLVSQVDLKKFYREFKEQMYNQQQQLAQENKQESPGRGPASVKEETEVPQNTAQTNDVIREAFRGAARTMNSIENVSHLTQGLASIKFQGLKSPVQLRSIKQQIYTALSEDLSSLTERKIENGDVTLFARTKLKPVQLLAKMSFLNSVGFSGRLSDDGKSILFTAHAVSRN